MGRGFTWESDDLSRDRAAAEAAWAESRRLIAAGAHAVVILDELTYVINYGFVPLDERPRDAAATPAPRHRRHHRPQRARRSSPKPPTWSPRCARSSTRSTAGKKAVPGLDY